MKQVIFSAFFVILFSLSALTLRGDAPVYVAADILTSEEAPADVQITPSENTGQSFATTSSFASSAPVQPAPQQGPVPVAEVTPANRKYKDGTYTGPVVDAYYGNVQVKVTTRNDRIVDVQFLDYPHARNTSVQINASATPALRSEAIRLQSARVDTVSGASYTSEGFRQSLSAALLQAAV